MQLDKNVACSNMTFIDNLCWDYWQRADSLSVWLEKELALIRQGRALFVILFISLLLVDEESRHIDKLVREGGDPSEIGAKWERLNVFISRSEN